MPRETLRILDTFLTWSPAGVWEWCVDCYEYSCRGADPFTLWMVDWNGDGVVAEASSLEAAVRISLKHAAAAILARAKQVTRAGRQGIQPGADRRLKP